MVIIRTIKNNRAVLSLIHLHPNTVMVLRKTGVSF